jgi:hypothetical protein
MDEGREEMEEEEEISAEIDVVRWIERSSPRKPRGFRR